MLADLMHHPVPVEVCMEMYMEVVGYANNYCIKFALL